MLGEKKILVVEDHPDIANIIQKLLVNLGYNKLLHARNGFDALKKAQEEIPDLILMDIRMPGMSGLEVARRLKADPLTWSIPILGMSASAMERDEEMCERSGCEAYLAKLFVLH